MICSDWHAAPLQSNASVRLHQVAVTVLYSRGSEVPPTKGAVDPYLTYALFAEQPCFPQPRIRDEC
jgi:hypothetical protein